MSLAVARLNNNVMASGVFREIRLDRDLKSF